MTTRTTVYLDQKLYKAAKIKSAVTEQSLSELINRALLLSLREDEADLSSFSNRRHESTRPFEDVLKDLKCDGLL